MYLLAEKQAQPGSTTHRGTPSVIQFMAVSVTLVAELSLPRITIGHSAGTMEGVTLTRPPSRGQYKQFALSITSDR